MTKVTDQLLKKVANISDKAYEDQDFDLSWYWLGKPDTEKYEQMQYPGDTSND